MTQKSCCKCQSTIIIQSSANRHSTWCRECFIDQLHIKFFQAFKIAKEYCRPPPKTNQLTKNNSSLVVHFENNLNSFVTLHLINNYLNTNKVRSTEKWKSPIDFNSIEVVWVNPGIASKYISTVSSVPHSDSEQHDENVKEEHSKIRSIVKSLGFKLVILHLEDLFKPSNSTSSSLTASDKSSSNISRCFVDLSDPNLPTLKVDCSPDDSGIIKSQKETTIGENQSQKNETDLENILSPLTKTSRNCLIEILTCITLINFCKQTSSNDQLPSLSNSKKQVNKVLIKPTSSTSLAIDTLLNVSLGNGFCLDQIVGPSSYINDVLICRPIYQILDIEIIEYSKFLNLSNPYKSFDRDHQESQSITNTTANPAKKVDNITSLLTEFIKKLEENYPLTSSVINQTVNKIGKNKPNQSNNKSRSDRNSCRICLRALDSQANEWKKSITLSTHETGKMKKNEMQKKEESRLSKSNSKNKEEIGIESEEVMKYQNEKEKISTDEKMNKKEINSLRDDICFGCLVSFTDHLYSSNPSSQDHIWVQLPHYSSLDHSDHLHDVLDQFLMKD